MCANRVEEAVECFSGNCNCCQSIIMTYGPQFRLEMDVGIRMGTGFEDGKGQDRSET